MYDECLYLKEKALFNSNAINRYKVEVLKLKPKDYECEILLFIFVEDIFDPAPN